MVRTSRRRSRIVIPERPVFAIALMLSTVTLSPAACNHADSISTVRPPAAPAAERGAADPDLVTQEGHQDAVTAIFASADGQSLATVSDGVVKLWDREAAAEVRTLGRRV